MKSKTTGFRSSKRNDAASLNALQNTSEKTASDKSVPETPEAKPKEAKASSKKTTEKVPFRVIPLGGIEEIGKNITVFECEDDIIIVDCGIKFPDVDMYGIDLVLPDFSYLEEKASKIRGLFITHGHEDHIGGIPYFIKKFPHVPIFATRLTIGIITNKLVEHNLDKKANLTEVSFRSVVNVKGFSVEFIVTNHSIADSASFCIKCKGGRIVITGDYKIDLTPVDGQVIDLARLAQLGLEGVDLLVCDSTNANRKGYTPSEKTVGASFDALFANSKKRIIVATFATSIHRIQQIFDAAKTYKRKVAMSGRSMVNVVTVAKELKYLKFKDNILIDLKDVDKYAPEQIVLLMTGSQGEPLSALARMAAGEHRQLAVSESDMVIISASPIPGNEKAIAGIISELMKMGAEVIYQGAREVHVSGHGCQEELKIMHTLTKPRYFMPCHGEYHMLHSHAQLAMSLGTPKENVFIMKNGDVLEVGPEAARITGSVPAGQVLVDGLGVGDVGNIVMKDRRRLSQDGLLVVVATLDDNGILSGPDIVSRGFVYMRESDTLLAEAKERCAKSITRHKGSVYDYNAIKADIKNDLEKLLYDRTRRRPIVLPVLMYVKRQKSTS